MENSYGINPHKKEQARAIVRKISKTKSEIWEKTEDLRGAVERLLNIWYEPTHILIELLQNADDEADPKAPNDCQFILKDAGLIFKHHGNPFQQEHVEAISSINKTTKKPGTHIGYLGIGFKSVFKLTDSPHILCYPFSFRFSSDDVIVPRWVEKTEIPDEVNSYLESGWTTFYLPFKESMRESKKVDVKETLLSLDPISLVFLKKTRTIRVETEGRTRVFVKSSPQSLTQKASPYVLEVSEEQDDKKQTHNFLVFEKRVPTAERAKNDEEAKKNRKAELDEVDIVVAFPLDDKTNFKVEKRPLFTFLPTAYDTGLRFVISSDFLLDSSRGEPLWHSEWNIWLLECIQELIQDAIEDFKTHPLLKEKFYKVLPRKSETDDAKKNTIYEHITKPTLSYCLSSPIIFTHDGWGKCEECILIDKEFQDLVTPDKLGYRYFVNPNVEGKDFLHSELNILEVNGEEERKLIVELIKDYPWLAAHDSAWFKRFYELLYERLFGVKAWKLETLKQKEFLNAVKQSPFLLTTSKELTKAAEAILPPASKEDFGKLSRLPYLDIIEPSILTEKTIAFFKELGIQEATDEAIILAVLTKCSKDEWLKWTDEVKQHTTTYVKDWISKREDVPEKVMHKLSDVIVPLKGGGWNRAVNCYFSGEDLKELIPDILIVDESLAKDKTWKDFFEKAGVCRFPKVMLFAEKHPPDKPPTSISADDWREYWRSLGRVRRYYSRDESISEIGVLHGFDRACYEKNDKGLRAFLLFLCTNWNYYCSGVLTSLYHWVTTYGNPHSTEVDSYFSFQLKEKEWVPTNEGIKKPSETFLPLKDIKKVFGSLVPYIMLPENLLDKAVDFAKTIGINIDTGKEKLLLALSRAKLFKVDDKLKKSLERVYGHLALFAEGEKFGELLQEYDEIELLCEDGGFRKAPALYWKDILEFGECFEASSSFVWEPKLSRPQLEDLFRAFGIRKLSESITLQKEPIDPKEIIAEDMNFEKVIKQRLKYIYSILLDSKVEKASSIIDLLSKLKIIRVPKLRCSVKWGDKPIMLERSAFYDVNESTLYLNKQGTYLDAVFELVRVFSIPTTYASHIKSVFEEHEEQKIAPFLNMFRIQIVDLPEGEKEEGLIMEKIHEMKEREEGLGKEPQLIDERRFESKESLESEARKVLTRGEQPLDLSEIYEPVEEMKIDRPIITPPKLVVGETKKPIAGLDLQPISVGNEEVLVTPGMPIPPEEKIKKFRGLLAKILSYMGADSNRVKIIIKEPTTEARSLPDYPDLIGFNATLIDRSPIFWIIIAGRELAALKYKDHYPHVKAMCQLIEKAIEHLADIYPEFFELKGA
jgi:hypothetical protein